MFKIKNLSFFFIFSIILIFIQFSYQFSFLDIYNINYSFQDLKYSGSKLFLNGENIYKIYLDDPSDQRILGSQYPNYSIASIYFHLPLGFFSFDLAKIIWRIFSIILLAHTYIILSNSDLEIKKLGKLSLLELFHGPTLAFKDIAMQIIGNMYEKILKKK